MRERWSKVEEHPIEVSDRGRVRSLAWGKRTLLRPVVGTHGYPQVRWWRSGVRYTSTVHRLVLLAFVGPRPPKMEARHLDGDRSNCAVGNLTWGTKVENRQDAVRHGTRAGLTKEQAAEVKALLLEGYSNRAIAELYGISNVSVHAIRHGQAHREVEPAASVERRPQRRRLTPEAAAEIRSLAEGGVPDARIAAQYGVSPAAVWAIKTGRTHREAVE